PPPARTILRAPIATFWRPDEWGQIVTGTGVPSDRLRAPHMHTTWRPEEFRALSGGPKLDKLQSGSDTPPRAKIQAAAYFSDARYSTTSRNSTGAIVAACPSGMLLCFSVCRWSMSDTFTVFFSLPSKITTCSGVSLMTSPITDLPSRVSIRVDRYFLSTS